MSSPVPAPSGRERIREALRALPECPRHRQSVEDGACRACLEHGERAGRVLRAKLESPAWLGGSISRAVANYRGTRQRFDELMRERGLGSLDVEVRPVLAALLDARNAMPPAIRANARLAMLVADARVAHHALEEAIEAMRYAGRPLEEKLLRLFAASDESAAFLDGWDGVVFDGPHELELEDAARRMLVNDRDSQPMLATLCNRGIDSLQALARTRRERIGELLRALGVN